MTDKQQEIIEDMGFEAAADYVLTQPWGDRAEAILRELRAESGITEPIESSVIAELMWGGPTAAGRQWDTGNTSSTLYALLEDLAADDVAAILAARAIYGLQPLV